MRVVEKFVTLGSHILGADYEDGVWKEYVKADETSPLYQLKKKISFKAWQEGISDKEKGKR